MMEFNKSKCNKSVFNSSLTTTDNDSDKHNSSNHNLLNVYLNQAHSYMLVIYYLFYLIVLSDLIKEDLLFLF